MTKEDKELLLKDLCARLPYGVMLRIAGRNVNLTTCNTWIYFGATDEAKEYIKPYLRPLSSMTREERMDWREYMTYIEDSCYEFVNENIAIMQDWINAHHFDYRGLIYKGLALEAPKDMYKI